MYAYKSLRGAFVSIARQGPQELLRGFMASALRDAPYAGLFVVFYEGIKREASRFLFLLNVNHTQSHSLRQCISLHQQARRIPPSSMAFLLHLLVQ
jgi:hypothetical protein